MFFIIRNKLLNYLTLLTSLHNYQYYLYYFMRGSDTMKIEKINENQIKLTLTNADLTERNIKLEELISPSNKTQELFRDIMEQAFTECGFCVDNAPLMVEATPVALDGLMIIVTKIQDKDSQKDKLSLISQNKELRRFKRKSIDTYTGENVSDNGISIYSFDALDDVINASIRLNSTYSGYNILFKYTEKYFLLIQNDSANDDISDEDIENIVSEYGTKHISTVLSKYHLLEHGEVIVKNPAIKTLAMSFS